MIDNESNKFLVKIANQEYALFKNDRNNQDEKLNGNTNFINNIRYKKDNQDIWLIIIFD